MNPQGMNQGMNQQSVIADYVPSISAVIHRDTSSLFHVTPLTLQNVTESGRITLQGVVTTHS